MINQIDVRIIASQPSFFVIALLLSFESTSQNWRPYSRVHKKLSKCIYVAGGNLAGELTASRAGRQKCGPTQKLPRVLHCWRPAREAVSSPADRKSTRLNSSH